MSQTDEALLAMHRLEKYIEGLNYRACPPCREKLLKGEIQPNVLHVCTPECLDVLKDCPSVVAHLKKWFEKQKLVEAK